MSGEHPAISVGLPVYNGENYLEEALESLLTQEFSDFELIISDNASSDRTPAILTNWATRDPRIRLHTNETNLGGASNFNLVLDLARGRFFRWASHDDLVTPDMLSRCSAELERLGEDYVLVYPQTTVIDANGDAVEVFDNMLDLRDADPVQRLRGFIRGYQRSNVMFGLLRTSAIRSTGGIPGYNPGDVVMIGALALSGRFAELPAPLFKRREHDAMSWRSARTPERFAQWFDPTKEPMIVFPRWRAWRGLMTAAWHSPHLSASEKVRASLVLSYEWPRRNLRSLVQELTRIPKVVARALLKSPTRSSGSAS